MQAQFIHLADAHLGHQQYGSPARFDDFARAFFEVVEYAIKQQVDFVIIAGDLFHKQAIDPPTLLQAVTGLQDLRQAGIPVIAVEGNHDRARYRDVHSWLDFLVAQSYLHLLSPVFQDGSLNLVPWDGEYGSFVDIQGIRIYGVRYLGASTSRYLTDILERLATSDNTGIEYTIFVTHAGLEGEVPHYTGGLSQNQIAPLQDHVDYLALGHIHKNFEREGWIYNPGSLETCGMDEWQWEGGFYHVTVDTGHNPRHQARHIKNDRRPFHRFTFSVEGLANPPELYDRLQSFLAEKGEEIEGKKKPVIELSLHGVLDFNRSELDIAYVQSLVEEAWQPLIARVRNDTRPTEFEVAVDPDATRPELERRVLRDLIERDARYRPASAAWAELMVQIKNMVLAGSAPESIVSQVRGRMGQLEENVGQE